MARLRNLLAKIPGHDIQMALHQWTLGLRQPFRVEVAKMYPKTLSEAEAMVTRLEGAMEFRKGGWVDMQYHHNNMGGRR